MFRVRLFFLVLLASLFGNSASTQAYKFQAPLLEALQGAGCADFTSAGHVDSKAIALLSPWAPNIHKQVLAAITADRGITRADWQGADTVQAYAERVVSGDARATEKVSGIIARLLAGPERQLLADARKHGRAVCDILSVQEAFGAAQLFKLQKDKPGNAHPYAAIGQALLTTAGCEVGKLDGSMGPQTVAAYGKVLPGADLLQRAGNGPDWLLDLYPLRAGNPTCSPSALTPSRLGLPLAAVAHLYAEHRARLLVSEAANCGSYLQALAGYAAEVERAPPDAALAKALEAALRGLKETLTCLEDIQDPKEVASLAQLFFKRGLHATTLNTAHPRAIYGFARALLMPQTAQADFPVRAMSLLTLAHESGARLRANWRPNPSGESERVDDTDVKAAALLAWGYETGTGVARDAKQATRWAMLARRSLGADYPWQANQQGNGGDPDLPAAAIEAHAGWLLAIVGFAKPSPSNDRIREQGSGSERPEDRKSENVADGGQLMSLPGKLDGSTFHRVAELCDLYVQSAGVRALVGRDATPFGKFAIATVLIEGHGATSKRPGLGVALLQEASNERVSAATLRLAQAYELGLGLAADLATARSLYQQAAAAGQTLANLALARFYDDGVGVEQDMRRADQLYRAAMAPLLKDGRKPQAASPEAGQDDDRAPAWLDNPQSDRGEPPQAVVIVDGLRQQLVKGSPYFSGPLGAKLLNEIVAANPIVTTYLGRFYLCADCGAPVKTAQAAQWFRRGVHLGSMHSAYALARLIENYPELARDKEEATRLLRQVAASDNKRALEATLLLDTLSKDRPAGATPAGQIDRVKAQCQRTEDRQTYTVEDCIETAHRLAIGAVSPSLVKVGYEALRYWAHREDLPADDLVRNAARVALFDVLAMYGNFGDALELLRDPATDLSNKEIYSARNQTFSRLIIAIAESKGKNLSADFDALLSTLEGKGDVSAPSFRQALGEQRTQVEKPARPMAVADAREAFEVQLGLGGFSHALASTGRTLSRALLAADKKDEALAYELVALNAQNELAKAAAIEAGPLPADLIMACQLARSSERVQEMGFTDVATVLAKEAVNKLQDVRTALVGLPQNFRTCFAELTSDQYRLLFSLFIRQGRTAEAEAVNRMLKDAEAYEYVGLDQDYVHRAFDRLPMSELEQDVLRRAFAVKPIVTPRTERYWLLKVRRKAGSLSEAERIELKTLEAELRQQDAAFHRTTDELNGVVAALADPNQRRAQEGRQLDKLEPIKGMLRQTFNGKAAALHFVVLPDRMHAILTTATGQTSYTWRQIDGQPFTEARLNAKIDALRRAVETRSPRAADAGDELYRLLFLQSSFDRELAAVGAEMLLLSLDRRLRYLPFAALKSGNAYLVEKYALVMLTESVRGNLAAPPRAGTPTVAAFGTSRSVGGFAALPNVGEELRAIVKVDERPASPGIFKGGIKLDQDFTLEAFQDAFVRAPDATQRGGTIVHVASHFQISNREDTSFLLLGPGDKLPVREIKDNGTVYDFGDVDLLTLSACATAYAAATPGQGQDLESFATVIQRKGARAVLATLWPVADPSTAAFMERFYRLQAEEQVPRAVALARAQREFIKGGQGRTQPFYWAPFVLIGNWQ